MGVQIKFGFLKYLFNCLNRIKFHIHNSASSENSVKNSEKFRKLPNN